MDRTQQILAYASLSKLGIEIAPYHNPLVRKSDGNNVLIIDVFDTQRLRENLRADPGLPNGRLAVIEEVDLVGDASNIAELAEAKGLIGKVHYIVSSHNFEHLPNPIKFLRGCEQVLAPGGVLSMAIPDYRACFDHFRYPTRLSDWLSAYHGDSRQPSPAIVFENDSTHADFIENGIRTVGCTLDKDNPTGFSPVRNLGTAYQDFLQSIKEPGPYRDKHCSVMFGKTFELMVRDIQHLGLIGLEIVEVSPTNGLEFYAHLRKCEGNMTQSDDAFYQKREELMRAVTLELGAAYFERRVAQRRRAGGALTTIMNALPIKSVRRTLKQWLKGPPKA